MDFLQIWSAQTYLEKKIFNSMWVNFAKPLFMMGIEIIEIISKFAKFHVLAKYS